MLTIKDHLGALTTEQAQSLRDKSAAYPFDLFVTLGATGSRREFEAEVASYVSRPGVLSVGVDPAHRFTHVRGSKDLGLPNGAEVASTGNPSFKAGDLVGGIDQIAASANSFAKHTRLIESASGSPIVVETKPMDSGWWFALGGVGVIVLAIGLWVWLTNRSRHRAFKSRMAELNNALGDAQLEVAARREVVDFDRRLAETVKRPVRPAVSYRRVPTPPPPPAPVIVQSSNNDLLTGIVIGDMLNDPPRVVERAPEPAPSTSSSSYSSSDSSSSWSSSSSSSSWDSSSSSSSSSSWDSGSSGGDWGGGGGGSDW